MASDTRVNPSAFSKFNHATVAYIIPTFLVVLNMTGSYQATEFNIAVGVYLFLTSLFDDGEPANPEPKKTGLDKDKAVFVRLY